MDLRPIIGDYIPNLLKSVSKIKMFLPFDCPVERYLVISLEGFNECVISHNDLTFNGAMHFMGLQMHNLKKVYGREYLFTEPQMIIKPGGMIFQFKIGILNRKDYNKYKMGKKSNHGK